MANRARYLKGLISLTIIYVVFYGGLLYYTEGLPYVLDNNETFSLLWHAKNLFNFGLSQSFGLADESFSYSAAAHPFVHTHQGNFPRLYAFVIYLLGARTAESQIIVTTFTVGLIALYFAYHFFFKVVGTLFAVIFCLVLFSDYVLVSQWQVVTYRVWYAFFVFSSLLCVHGCGESKRWWSGLTVINFACLFYFELVFAAFVFLASVFYASATFWRSPLVILKFSVSQAAGCAIGLSILALQLMLYMGWDNFLHDIYLTFIARNHYDGSARVLEDMRTFFESNNIVFWHNLVDGSRYRNILHFAGSLTYYEFQLHTPFFTTLCWITLLGLIVAYRLNRNGVPTALPNNGWTSAGTIVLLAVAVFTLFSVVFGRSSLWGIHDPSIWLSLASLRYALLYGIATGMVLLILYACWARPARNSLFLVPDKVTLTRALRTAIFILVAATLISESWIFYNEAYAALGHEVSRSLVPEGIAYLFVLVSVVIGAALIRHPEILEETGVSNDLTKIGIFLLSGMAAYAVVFVLSPGYVFSGYRFRLAPFTVFFTQVLIAVVFYILILFFKKHWNGSFQQGKTFISIARGIISYRNLLLAVASFILFWFLLVYWFRMQAAYIQLFPPDNYLFINKLSSPPYKGKSFIVNGYAAPIAEKSGNWAYLHAALTDNKVTILDDQIRIPFDSSYLWFADKKTNPSYEKPDYFICITHQSLSTVNYKIAKESKISGYQRDCADQILVRLARNNITGKKIYPALELSEIDIEGKEKVGFVRWAIVKLNWKQ